MQLLAVFGSFFGAILFNRQSQQPRKITTDKLASYKAALRDLGRKTPHITKQYQNNDAELRFLITKHASNNDKCGNLLPLLKCSYF